MTETGLRLEDLLPNFSGQFLESLQDSSSLGWSPRVPSTALVGCVARSCPWTGGLGGECNAKAHTGDLL